MATNVSANTKDFTYRVYPGNGDRYEGHTTRWQAVAAAARLSKRGHTPEIHTFDKAANGYVRDNVAHEQLVERTTPNVGNGNVDGTKQALNELSGLALAVKKMLSSREQEGIEDLKAALAAKYAECEELLGL